MPKKIDNEDDLDAIEEILESIKGLGNYREYVIDCIVYLEHILSKNGRVWER